MHGIVTVLAEPHHKWVETIWQELKQRFGVSRPEGTSVPHFSYHVAATYDLEKLKTVMLDTAASTPPFTVKTSGIGIFPGDLPVLYIPVARSPQLQALHATLWPRLQAIAHASLDYYAPNNWFPHITLSHNDITPDQLGPIVTWLNKQPLAWDVQITNLTLLHDNTERHVPLHRAKLEG